MIKKLKSINHIILLDDYYLLEPKIEWDIYGIIFKDGPFEHISVGFSYLIDSTLEHTTINGSNDWRLHLVGDIKD
jgi:hypothetical protein